MTHLKTTLLAAAFALATGSAFAANDSKVSVENESSWVITEFYLSPTEEAEWGPDLLGSEVLGTGDTVELTNIVCGEWDVRLVDEDGDECTVGAVPLCGDSEAWTITDDALLECEAETE